MADDERSTKMLDPSYDVEMGVIGSECSSYNEDGDDQRALTSQKSWSFNEIYQKQTQEEETGNKSLPRKTRFAPQESSTAAPVASSSSSAAAAGSSEGMSINLKKRNSFHYGNGNAALDASCSPDIRSCSSTPRKSSAAPQHSNVALFRTRSRLSPGVDKQISRLREELQQQELEEQQQADEKQLRQQQQQQQQREKQQQIHHAATASDPDLDARPMPVRRYFDALRGPELEELHDWEHALLPRDRTWPFLLRFPISSFGIVLGLGSQSILWKQLSAMPSVHFMHAPPQINQVLWLLATVSYCAIAATYMFKIVFYFEAVRREYYHPVRVNFFFAPWIAAMFLALGVPEAAETMKPRPWTWCILMAPLLSLELKIYGQWLSGGERRLSKVANPSTHLSVVGNFVGALLGASVGWTDGAVFFWSIGLAHYLVLFVTLYQRLPTNETLPKELHPVFFLFVAAPSAASAAWEKITGDFGLVSRVIFFIALFLFTSLVVRINFFRGFKFSLAWWAYTFPMTALSIASIRYSQKVTSLFTQGLAVTLSSISALTVFLLFISTMCHLFYWKTLFPNDMAIAITHRKKGKGGGARKNCNQSSSTTSTSTNDSDSLGNGFFGAANGKDENERHVCTAV